jgi:hypothetical protein
MASQKTTGHNQGLRLFGVEGQINPPQRALHKHHRRQQHGIGDRHVRFDGQQQSDRQQGAGQQRHRLPANRSGKTE